MKEINLISQDTTYFGMDRWTDARPNPRSKVDSSKGESLASLLRELDQIEGDFWVRLLYTHPAHWSDELIETIGRSKHVVRYVDIPLQHVSDKMLGAMQRETDGAYIRDLIKRMRAGIPDLVIRTTFIVGFPARPKKTSPNCSPSSKTRSSTASACSSIPRKKAPRAPRWKATSPTR